MAAGTQGRPSPPTCEYCDREMDEIESGRQRSIPLVGSEMAYVRFACPDCGQGARFERPADGGEWSRAGT
jgi:hypothetical protein